MGLSLGRGDVVGDRELETRRSAIPKGCLLPFDEGGGKGARELGQGEEGKGLPEQHIVDSAQ